MELRDLIVTPIILAIVYLLAYIVRPRVTDQVTRNYFFPALTAKIIGALAVGFIYQFYYPGGDTFNYHSSGSRVIWRALLESPSVGFQLFMEHPDVPGGYVYTSRMLFYSDPSSYFVIQLATVFDLFTFSSYSGTAVLFAVLAMVGSWLMFLTFYDLFPHLHKLLAAAIFYIPSVLFWGSGLLKDTITLSCVGSMLYFTYALFVKRRFKIGHVIFLIVSLLVLYRVKIYILLTFLPAIILWVFFENLTTIKNKITRAIVAPLVVLMAVGIAVFAAIKAGEDNPKYALDKIAKTAQITSYDIRYWSGKNAGSGYTLGELDGTFNSMVKLAPLAIVVSLFRPFLWEVKNPLMLMSALEAFVFLCLFVFVLVRSNFFVLQSLSEPSIIFCLAFSIVFAFAVGVSTYNFGTLVRYKIPMLPFFLTAIILIDDFSKKKRIERMNR